MSLLERIRNQPSAVKGQIAFATAAVVTGCIGLVWMTTLPAQLAQTTETEDASSEDMRPLVREEVPPEQSFFGDVSTMFSEQFGALAERFKDIDFSRTESGVANVGRSTGRSTPEAATSTSDVSTEASTQATSTSPSAAQRTILIGTSSVHSIE